MNSGILGYAILFWLVAAMAIGLWHDSRRD